MRRALPPPLPPPPGPCRLCSGHKVRLALSLSRAARDLPTHFLTQEIELTPRLAAPQSHTPSCPLARPSPVGRGSTGSSRTFSLPRRFNRRISRLWAPGGFQCRWNSGSNLGQWRKCLFLRVVGVSLLLLVLCVCPHNSSVTAL